MTERAPGDRRWVLLIALLSATASLAVACGSDDPADAAGSGSGLTGQRVADQRLEGSWRVSSIVDDGEETTAASTVLIELDTTFGDVAVDSSCGSDLGAFSLFDDGRAGFSLTGGSQRDCDAASGAEREQLVTVLTDVTGWKETAAGLRFTTPSGDQVDLTR